MDLILILLAVTLAFLAVFAIISGAVVLIYFLIREPKQTKSNENNQQTIINQYPSRNPTNYNQGYQPKFLLSKNEWNEHRKLQKPATEKGLIVCPKVRLLDIIEPRRGEKKYKTLLYKIQSKHVDFLICDQNMRIKAVLELDDNSHDRKDRQERDEFVNQILTSVGYTVIHTRAITETTLDVLNPPAPAGD